MAAIARTGRPERMGGSFAPPLDAERIALYRELAAKAGGAVETEMLKLCDMVEAFLETPEVNHARTASKQNGTPHPSGVGFIVPLSADTIKKLDKHVPYPHEITTLGGHPEGVPGLFDKLPAGTTETPRYEDSEEFSDRETRIKQVSAVESKQQKDIRDAAFHLLWFAKELEMDRVPMTTDMLPKEMQALSVGDHVTVRPLSSKSTSSGKRQKKGR